MSEARTVCMETYPFRLVPAFAFSLVGPLVAGQLALRHVVEVQKLDIALLAS
jgi:hypothetical protein